MKKLISLCFAIALCFALSVAAMAAHPTTLTVGDVEVVKDGVDTGSDSDTWRYDNGTLTLNYYDGGSIYVKGDLKIYLSPDTVNNVGASDYGDFYAAIYSDGVLQIEGSGTLNANGKDNSSGIHYGIYVTGSGLTVFDGTINAYGGSVTESGSSCGIYAAYGASVDICNGNVTAKGGKVLDHTGVSHGISVSNNFCVTGVNTTVTAIGNWNSLGITSPVAESYGIVANNVTIENGSVTATGGYAVDSMGIKSNGKVNIESGTVIATAGQPGGQAPLSVGIYSDKDITLSGGNVTAKGSYVDKTAGDSYGIYSYTGNIDMSKLEEKSSITAEGKHSSMLAKGNITFPKAFKYVTEADGTAESGTDQTNMSTATAGGYLKVYTEEAEKIELNIALSWDDSDNINGLRPDEVKFKILADGAEKDTVTLTSENEWKTSVKLPKKDTDGKSILYGVELAFEVEGYYATITNENYNYTAKLSLDTYHVSYNSNGGEGLVSDITIYNYGDKATVKDGSALSKTGCTFAGWNTEADGSGTDYKPGDKLTVEGAITLYAVWELAEYTVTFNANGGEGEMESVTVPVGEALTLPECGFTAPENKRFAGWALSSNGEVLAGESIEISDDTELFAIWEDVSVIGSPNKKPAKPTPCDHEFDKNGVCTECGIKVITEAEKQPDETNPNTGAEFDFFGAAAVLSTALCLGKGLAKGKRK